MSKGTRECPYCAEVILAKARVCKHCGCEVAPTSEGEPPREPGLAIAGGGDRPLDPHLRDSPLPKQSISTAIVVLILCLIVAAGLVLKIGLEADREPPDTTSRKVFDFPYDVGDDPGKLPSAQQALLNKIKVQFVYRPLAEIGNAWAQYHLGFMHLIGDEEKAKEGFHWLQMAAEQGHPGAQAELGSTYSRGLVVPQDHMMAIKWMTKAAETGDAHAQGELGMMHEGRDGAPRDLGLARHWLTKSAEQGDASSQYALGWIYSSQRCFSSDTPTINRDYEVGTCLDVDDDAEAVRWYRRSAEQGHDEAQIELAQIYRYGISVPQDYSRTIYWYRKAAEQGNEWAQYLLGMAYAEGNIVQQDLVEAYVWLNLVAAGGDPMAICRTIPRCGDAHRMFDEVISYRNQISSKLTPAQLAKAQERSREFKPNESRF